MHPKMLLLGLCALELLCLSAQAIFESLCIILHNLSLCNSFTSRYGFVFKSVLPGTDVASSLCFECLHNTFPRAPNNSFVGLHRNWFSHTWCLFFSYTF